MTDTRRLAAQRCLRHRPLQAATNTFPLCSDFGPIP